MVKILEKKPEIFNGAKDHLIFLELDYKKEPYGYIALEPLNDFVAVHMESVKWSHNIAKILKIDWEEIKFICKSLGAKEIVASYDKNDSKTWRKFIKMYDFPEPQKLLVSRQEI